MGKVSQSKAAELTGLSRQEFLGALYRFNVSAFQVTPDELKEEIAEAQLAHLRDVQRDVQGQMLGQFLAPGNLGSEASQVLADLFRDTQGRLGGNFGRNGFRGRGAVGFRPELTVLPEGASLSGLAM